MIEQEDCEISNQGDFWSQVPVVLFTIAAVVAIVVVNKHTEAVAQPAVTTIAPPSVTTIAPPNEVRVNPIDCPDCGEVIDVRAADQTNEADSGQIQGDVILDVRMTDGTVRAIRQPSPGFEVGDRVQVNGEALVARN